MNKSGKWTLALGLAAGAVLAFTLTTRTGKKVRSETSKRVSATKSGITSEEYSIVMTVGSRP